MVGGIEIMTKIPDAVFVVDVKKEKTAFKAAGLKKTKFQIVIRFVF